MITLTGAGAVLCAAHLSRDGVMHGHTWEITAWWADGPCALAKRQELQSYLAQFDHTVLDESVAWAEQLAARILTDTDCVKVEISRPAERLYAIAARGGQS